jgi:hypothetical protein
MNYNDYDKDILNTSTSWSLGQQITELVGKKKKKTELTDIPQNWLKNELNWLKHH